MKYSEYRRVELKMTFFLHIFWRIQLCIVKWNIQLQCHLKSEIIFRTEVISLICIILLLTIVTIQGVLMVIINIILIMKMSLRMVKLTKNMLTRIPLQQILFVPAIIQQYFLSIKKNREFWIKLTYYSSHQYVR